MYNGSVNGLYQLVWESFARERRQNFSLFPNTWAALRVGRGEAFCSRAGTEQVQRL